MKAKVGDTIKLGKYPQSDPYTPESEPIEWKVLDIKDGNALILSRYGLENVQYSKDLQPATWADCNLRDWLNNTFLGEAFCDEARDIMVPVNIHTDDNPRWGTKGGEDSTDRIFALSYDEVKKYMPDKKDRLCIPTKNAEVHGAFVYDENGSAAWWVRDPGVTQKIGCRINCGGTLSELRYDDNKPHRVARPAMWIKLED